MTQITFHPLPTAAVEALRQGGADAYGNPPERAVSSGAGMPCRHCLGNIPEGAEMLILAHRPFGALQPYAETGPIFLCADPCLPFAGNGLPPILQTSAGYLLKGYTSDARIRYGTGQITAPDGIASYAAELLARDEIAFVDVRSASNNCFLTRITQSI
ncbi:DUF1203 domain-containing protein [uncultured Sulfitobacter sp.]|uniref:DUF1203 domain-containing protein n=1 Tax=uncultured Sulfitobacter sp. TaxID=191468 RepID=UPI00260CE26D|nr:DUF1203 domain-containing protein [uncultured Sulfitobacter sp.]